MNRPGFYFCICPDSELIKEHIQEQTQKYGFKGIKKVFWGDEDLNEHFWKCFMQNSLLGTSYVLILRKADSLNKDFWNKLTPILTRFIPKVWPFFCIEAQWRNKKPSIPDWIKEKKYWQIAMTKGWVWKHSGITPTNVIDYCLKLAKQKHIKFPINLLLQIKDILPLDGAGIKRELEKLDIILNLEGRKDVKEKDVSQIFSSSDVDIFFIIDELEKRDISKDNLWKELIEKYSEDFVFHLIGMLFRELKTLWAIKTGDIRILRLPKFIMNKKIEIAKKISLKDLADLCSLLLDIEFGIKSGSISPLQAIDYMVFETSLIFSND